MTAVARDIVPSFHLYGEAQQSGLPDIIHVETLKDRSQHHDWRIMPHRHHDLFQIMHFQATTVGIELDTGTQSFRCATKSRQCCTSAARGASLLPSAC
ncbi:MAG: hypothetical protein AAF968_13205, partial [Pseudomonadota bacterium]